MLSLRMLLPYALTVAVFLILCASSVTAAAPTTVRAKAFVAKHEAKLRPLEIAAGMAWWNANISGDDKDFERKADTQKKIDKALADKEMFAEVKALHENQKEIDDPIVRRCIQVLYLTYLEKQADPKLLEKIVELSNAFEKKFSTARAG